MLNRRQTLTTAAATAALMVPNHAGTNTALEAVDHLPAVALDIYAPPEIYDRYLRDIFLDSAAAKELVGRHMQLFERSGRPEHGEAFISRFYVWWRTLHDSKQRIRAATAGRKFSKQFAARFADHPAGYHWEAVFLGLEALSRGILNSLQWVPRIMEAAEHSTSVDASYFYGNAVTTIAKLYLKAPPFPMSIGNREKAIAALERARPHQEGTFALWYLFYAEALLQQDREAAFAMLDRIETDVTPIDVTTAYVLDTTRADVRKLRQAIDAGTYDKYTWDPLLEPAQGYDA